MSIDLRKFEDTSEVFSFDVFDTTLTRATGKPEGIFSIMQNCLSSAFSDSFIQNFPALRQKSEVLVRQSAQREEITLQEIYDFIAKKHQLTTVNTHSLIKLEISTELQVSIPIPEIIEAINHLRKIGKRIVFTSDTYLPEWVIKKLLISAKAYHVHDHLYLSCSIGLTKNSGNLFRYLIEKERCDSRNILHIGDNLISDIKNARSQGLQVENFIHSHHSRYESRILSLNPLGFMENIIAGASRNSRLVAVENSALYSIGAEVAGPVIFCYVLWILNEANKKNIKKIYFVARDGQILYQIAQQINKTLSHDIELHYLYGSRQAWHLPAIDKIGIRDLNWMLEEDPVLTPELFAKRIGIDPVVITNIISTCCKLRWKTNRVLSKGEIDILKAVIQTSSLNKLIKKRAEIMRKKTIGYFISQGITSAGAICIVDIGWQGRLQDSLQKILTLEGYHIRIQGFYFGLMRLNNVSKDNQKEAFFFSPQAPKEFQHIGSKSGNIMEILTAADHGSTQGYDFVHKDYIPKLKSAKNTEAIDWGLGEFRMGIFSFIKQIDKPSLVELKRYEHTFSSKKVIANILGLLTTSPSIQEATILGNFPFSSDQTETTHCTFAPRLTFLEAIKFVFSDSLTRLRFTYWPEGSAVRSALPTRLLLHPFSLKLVKGVRFFKKQIGKYSHTHSAIGASPEESKVANKSG